MPKYIKYLENGTYKYATVKDVGDLLQLKTSTKKDIVSAINELIAGGISGGGSGGDGLTTEDIINIINGSDAVTDINNQISQMAADIKANKDEFDQDVTATQKELNDRMDKVQTDIQKVIDDYQTAQDAKNKEQAENITNLNNENTQIKNDLAGAKEDLENVQGDLSNFDHDMTEVKQSVNDVKGELDSKVSSTELDATNGRIDKTETDIAQNKKDIELKASQDSLDLLKGDVSKNTAALKVANDAIEGKVSREDLVNEVEDFTVKKANLFTGTREWQGWEESNSAEVIITDQKDNFGTATEFLNVSDYISLTVDNLKVGETYTISVSARSDKDTDGTVAQVFDIGEFQTTDTKDTFVRTTLQRYYVNFVATDESMTFKLGAKSLANQAHLFLSKAKLETGAKATMWEDNANDSYARIEKNDADVKVLADRVISTVSKQKETDDKVTQNTTDIAQTAEKVETNIKALQSQDGRITENKAQITATANGLRTEFTQKTNDAIGAITDGGKNLILSSAFQTDPAMKNWQSVNNKVVVKEKNSQNWAYMNQSGLSTDNPIGLTSNYFAMKANDPLVIAFDIIIGDVSKLDNKTVLNVSYYDKDDNRVDFKDYTLTDLGIESPANGATNRAYIKVNTTHDDVVKGAILPRLSRNGEIWMSNFFAKISSISNGDYEVANADLEDMQSTDHFKLEQTAQGLAGKADSSQLNKLSGDLTTLSNNFSTTSAGFQASLSKIDDKVDTNKSATDKSIADTNSALTVAKADIKATADNLSTNYTKTTDEHNYVNSQIKQSADKINLSVASVSDKVDGLSYDNRNLLLDSTFTKVPGKWNYDYKGITPTHDSYNNLVLTIPNGATKENRIYQALDNISWNDTVTFSFYAYVDSNSKADTVEIGAGGYDSLNYVSVSGGNLKKYSVSFKWGSASSTFTLSVGTYQRQIEGTILHITKVKLEKGTKATDWTPAPEDTDSKIAALQIVDDQIKSTVSNKADTSYVDQKADEISSTVTSVSNKIDNLNVNNRNLAVWHKWQLWGDINSKKYVGTTTQSIELDCDNTAHYQGIRFTVDMKGSSKYVLSFDATLEKGTLQGIGGHTGAFSSASVYIDGKKTDSVWSSGTNTTYKVGDKHHYEIHFISKDEPNNDANVPGFFLQPNRGNDSKNDQVTVLFENIMIQEGDKATGYTLAPEDMATVTALSKVDQKADSISTTVTNNKSDADSKFTNINQTINGIQSTVKNKADSSTVTQLSNQINLKVDTSDYNTAMGNKADKDNLVSQINIDKSGVLISGNKVHITGDTTIDNASIDGAKIKNATIGNAQITGTLSGKAINGSTFTAQNDDITTLINKDGVTQSKTNSKFNMVYDSEFNNGAETWILDKTAYTTNLQPTIDGSNRMGFNNSLSASYLPVAQSNPQKIVPNAKYSASCNIIWMKDAGITLTGAAATMCFFNSSFQRINNQDMWADMSSSKDNVMQYLKVENITPPSGAAYVSMWLQVFGPGKGHVIWTQPYITPYATVGEYVPDTVSGNNTVSMKNGYIDLPMNTSRTMARSWMNFGGANSASVAMDGRGVLSGNGLFINDQVHNADNDSWITLYSESLTAKPQEIASVVIDNYNNDVTYKAGLSGGYGLSIAKTDPKNTANNHGAQLQTNGLNFDSTILAQQDNGNFRINTGKQAALFLENDGRPLMGSPNIYNRTYSGSSNVQVTGYGTLGRVTSASKYKLDIMPINKIVDKSNAFLAIQPKQWFDKAETELFSDKISGNEECTDDAKVNPYMGFIAEDLQIAGLDDFLIYGTDGSLEGVQYDRLPVLHHQLIRQAYDRIDYLETKLNIMEQNMKKLEDKNESK